MGLAGDRMRRRWSRCARAMAQVRSRASAVAWAIGVCFALSLVSWLTVVAIWRGRGSAGLSSAADLALKSIGNVSEMAFLPTRAVVVLGLWFAPEPFPTVGALRSHFLYHLAAWGVVALAVGAACAAVRTIRRSADGPISPSRRRFLRAGVGSGGAAIGAGTIAATYATLVEPNMLRTTRHTVAINGLPRELDGLRIAQLSDTHLGRRVTAAHIARAVRTAIELKPDVFALTGDYVSGGPELHAAATDLLRPIAATGRPVASVLGNHDWFHDGLDLARCLRERGLNPIDNRCLFLTRQRTLTVHAGRGVLALAGVGDLTEDRVSFGSALDGIPDAMPRVLLSHQPDAAELDPGGRRVDLMLAGHTHGGQVRLPLVGSLIVPSRYGDRYAHGLVRGPWCPVVITSGVGTSILPVRFGMPPEVVEVTLRRAEC